MAYQDVKSFTAEDDAKKDTKRFVDDEMLGEVVIDKFEQLTPEAKAELINGGSVGMLLIAILLTLAPILGIIFSTIALTMNIYAALSGARVNVFLIIVAWGLLTLHLHLLGL